MGRKRLRPVTIAGIEFDALLDETKNLAATIPVYPVESGFPVSDTIILEPLKLQMTLYVSNTPVTWLYRHGSSGDRVKKICDRIENLWMSKELVKIVTTDTIYKDMGITSLTIKKSRETGYAREIALSAQKVRVTQQETTEIPGYILKSGKTLASAGTASVSGSSAQFAYGGEVSSGAAGSDNKGFKAAGSAQKSQSILYGVASGLKLI